MIPNYTSSRSFSLYGNTMLRTRAKIGDIAEKDADLTPTAAIPATSRVNYFFHWNKVNATLDPY